MKPEQFVKTIYLGDRAVKKIEIDGWNKTVKIQVDEISRIRDSSGHWECYNDENITDGYMVFENVSSFTMNPQGYLPNDWIDIISVIEYEKIFEFTISVGHAGIIDGKDKCVEITLSIKAEQFYLEDPKKPDVKICE
ncbi:MAG: DUF6258 family protein [Anaerohalosphaeraceae bacterium]